MLIELQNSGFYLIKLSVSVDVIAMHNRQVV